MTKEEKLARKQQRKAEKVGLGKLLLWNSSSCSVALSTLIEQENRNQHTNNKTHSRDSSRRR